MPRPQIWNLGITADVLNFHQFYSLSRDESIEFSTIPAVFMVLFWCHLIDWDCHFICGSRESSLDFNNVPTPIPTRHLAPDRSNTPDQTPLAHDPLALDPYRYSSSYSPCSRPVVLDPSRCSIHIPLAHDHCSWSASILHPYPPLLTAICSWSVSTPAPVAAIVPTFSHQFSS